MSTKPEVKEQAQYIFSIGKMLRQHVFSSLMRVEQRQCPHGELSLAQLNMVLTVQGRKEVTLSELADLLNVSAPSVSVMVDRLVERGLLVRERATSDRRKVVIRVSPDAGQMIGDLEEQMVKSFVEIVESVGPETAKKWFEVLQQVEKYLQEKQTREEKGAR